MVLPSPDGKKIYYWQTVTGDQRYSAYVERDLFTGNEKELVRRNALGRAAISPDGKFLLVNADNNIILLVPLDGSPVRELMRSTSPRLNVTMWAPDSRSVYVWSGTEQTRDTLWNVSISGGTPRKVDLGMPLDFAGGVMMVSPDGKQVVYSAGRGTETTEVRVLENFLPPLK
jgi:Tol biopolymer transport system component